MQRLKLGRNAIALLAQQTRTVHLFIEKRAVEMPSYDQPVCANRRAHRLLTGLGKLAKRGCPGILRVAAGEFTTVPQPRLRLGKEKRRRDVFQKREDRLTPTDPLA